MKTSVSYFQKLMRPIIRIKQLFIFVLLLSAQASIAQYSISNVVLNPASSSTIATGEDVNLTFNYTKPAGSTRIFILPMNNGLSAPGYAVDGSPLYIATSGSGKCAFTLKKSGDVDQLRFQFVNPANNALLYEKFVNVNYKFLDYNISNVVMNPASPATLTSGDEVNLSFNYIAKGGNVRIFARPMKGGVLASGYAASGSPIYSSSTGSGTGSFTLRNDGSVDQVRIQIVNASTSAVHYEKFISVNYSFINYQISNFVKSPSSPATLFTGENVNLTFNYRAKDGNVRIFARPMRAGSLAPGYAASGSPIYSSSTGSGTGTFTLSTGGLVDQIRFQIVDASSNEVLYQKLFNVAYTFEDYNITNLVKNPASFSTLTTGEKVNLTFNYRAKGGNVRIFARPMTNGLLSPGYAAHGSSIYTSSTGSGTGFFTLNIPGNVDQIRIEIINASNNAVLYSNVFSAYYTFSNYDITDVVATPDSFATLTTGEKVNLTFNYRAKGGNVRIFARPITNGLPSTGYAAHGSPLYTATTGSGTGFFTLNIPGHVDQIRFQIIDASNNAVLFEKLIYASYNFVNYDIYNLVTTPYSNSILTSGEKVNLTFNYNSSMSNVRIFARPITNGLPSTGYAAHGSPLYTAKSGSGTGFFTLNLKGHVDQIRFEIIDDSSDAVLYTEFFNVDFNFVDYAIADVNFYPARFDSTAGDSSIFNGGTNRDSTFVGDSLGTDSNFVNRDLTVGDSVSVTFTYRAKGGNVRIFARPMTNGLLSPGYAASGSPLYTTPTGSGYGFFTLYTPGHVDQVRFQIYNENQTALLYETLISVDYTFKSNGARIIAEPETVNISKVNISPMPASDHFKISHQASSFTYQLFNSNGLLVNAGKSNSSEVEVNTQNYTPGIYLLVIINGEEVVERKVVIQ